MINNVLEDETPYFLTADHATTSCDPNLLVFWFNWEASGCSNPLVQPTYQSISGATILAASAPTDMSLLELSATPPNSYSVYYSGWDISDSIPSFTTTIHHPSGDIKKISVDNDSPVHDYLSGVISWKINSWDVGVTEPGSSGAALFDENKRIIGQLYGGTAACNGASINGQSDYFGRLAHSWYGNAPSQRLKDWLDPTNTGTTTIGGLDPNANSGMFAYDLEISSVYGIEDHFCNETQVIPTVMIENNGSSLINSFTISCIMNGTTFSTSWSGLMGPGGSEAVTLYPMPIIDGFNDLNIVTTNINGNHTDQNPANNDLDFDFNAVTNGLEVMFNLQTDNYGSETSWNIKDDQNNIVYEGGPYPDIQGGSFVEESLCLSSGCYQFEIYDSYGDGICCNYGNGFYSIETPDNTLQFVNGSGNFGTGTSHTFCIQQATEIEELDLNSTISIYPNPTNRLVNINSDKFDITDVQLFSITGRLIKSFTISNKVSQIDISQFPAGMYFLTIKTEKGEVSKKITLL